MAAVCMQAQIKVGSLYYDNFTSSTAVVTSAPEDEKYAGDITIPRSITPDQRHKFDVVGIGSNAFKGCSGLTSISIPSSGTTIGFGAFYQCTNLQSVTFSATSQLKTIEYSAFTECESLSSIELPSTIESIGEYAFYCGNNLKTVICNATTVPDGTNIFLKDFILGTIPHVDIVIFLNEISTIKSSTLVSNIISTLFSFK